MRYLALESMCTLASSEFSHEAVKTHIETVINALKVNIKCTVGFQSLLPPLVSVPFFTASSPSRPQGPLSLVRLVESNLGIKRVIFLDHAVLTITEVGFSLFLQLTSESDTCSCGPCNSIQLNL